MHAKFLLKVLTGFLISYILEDTVYYYDLSQIQNLFSTSLTTLLLMNDK